jgi:two-component system cell cycle sensor histidine kinase PleC
VDYRVMVSVMDTGIGISKEDLARLAQPFQQVESQLAKTQQGTGLGLALSKSLIELHEGRFEIASEPGRGTTVSFILPIRQRQSRDRGGPRLDIEPGDYTATGSHG